MLRYFRRFPGFSFIPVVIGGIIIACVTAFLFGLIVMLLWNWIMPDIFGLKTITYWQGWGLVLLAHILFKTFPGPHRNYNHADKNAWKVKFKERFWKRPEEEVEKDDESSDTSAN